MYTLDDILEDSSKFQNGMFISFTQFVHCSRVRLQTRFFKGLGGTLRGQRLLCITFMTSQSHLWRCCCIMTSRGPWLLRRCFKRGFGDHRKQPIYEFNWIKVTWPPGGTQWFQALSVMANWTVYMGWYHLEISQSTHEEPRNIVSLLKSHEYQVLTWFDVIICLPVVSLTQVCSPMHDLLLPCTWWALDHEQHCV